MNPKYLFIKYQQLINKLPLEARAIILAAALGFIFVIWYYGAWKILQNPINTNPSKITALQTSISQLKIQISKAKVTLANKTKQAIIAKNTLKKKTSSTPSQLISSQQINDILQDLLTLRYNLTLLTLKNLPPKEIALPNTKLKIFEHGVTIKFQGNYFSTTNYLQAIENLGWRIFWDKLEYKVVKYPTAEITLQIHTLSNQKDWINV
jgi:MSHA biogenesis protein MshJ